MEEDEDDKEKEEQAEKRSPFGLSFPSDRAAFAFFLGKKFVATRAQQVPGHQTVEDTLEIPQRRGQ